MNDLPDDAVHDRSTEAVTNLTGQDWLSFPQPLDEAVAASPVVRSLGADTPSEAVCALLAVQRLDKATDIALDLLQRRIAGGDGALNAVRLVLRHYTMIVSRLAPLAHLGCAPLRPDDRLYQSFAEFVDLLHRQESQIRELEAIVADLV